jgi:ABC-type transport system involved in multi-copper enzyme maturation permease subunit
MTPPLSQRRPPTPLLGPLAGWEAVRLARRGQNHRGRSLVVYLLLIAFILTPVLWFWDRDAVDLFTATIERQQPDELARFGNRLVLVLFEAVLFGVVAMTPAYAATAIAEEKERQTLPLLLTSALSDREIVLGKAAGRLAFVLVAAAAALPVLVLARLFSPVEAGVLLAGCGLVAGTATLCIAVGLYAACTTPDLRAALLRAYGITAIVVGLGFVPPCVVASPFGILVWVSMAPPELWTVLFAAVMYPLIQTMLAAGLLQSAVRQLRTEDPRREPPRLAVVSIPDELRAVDLNTGWDPEPDLSRVVVEQTPAPFHRPPIADDDPLLWKERYVNGPRAPSADASRLIPWAVTAIGILLIVIGGFQMSERLTDPKHIDDEGGRLVMTGGILIAGAYLFPAAVALASAVARERRRNTLESLLAIPLDRRTVLRTKVRAAVERNAWWLPLTVLAAGGSFAADGGWRFGIAAAAFVLFGTGFVVGLGAYLTVRTSSEVQAFRFLVPAVVVVVGAPVGVWNATDWAQPLLAEVGLGISAVVFAVAGAVLWRRAGAILERADQRMLGAAE